MLPDLLPAQVHVLCRSDLGSEDHTGAGARQSAAPAGMKTSIIPVAGERAVPGSAAALSPLLRLARTAVRRALQQLEFGELRLIDEDGESRYGRKSAACSLSATLRIADPRFYLDTAFGGSVGAGEAYIRGLWNCDDLTAL